MGILRLKDPEAEQKVIAGIIKDAKKIDKVLLESNIQYFSEPLYRNLFRLITQVYIKHGSLITNELVSNYLESNGIEQSIRLVYLKELDELSKISVNDAEFSFALKSVHKAFVASSVSNILIAGTQVLESKGGSDAYKTIDKMLYDLKASLISRSSFSIVDTRQTEDLVELLEDMRKNPDKYKGIPTGWTQLDEVTGGFRKGEYALIIANSGGGKSMSLLNWATHAQLEGYNIVYVTLELSTLDIRRRQLSLASGIPFIPLKKQMLTVEQLLKQEDVLKNDFPNRKGAFYILDVPACSAGFIEAQLRQLQQNMKIDAVFIDYLGLLKPEAHISYKQTWERLAAISNDLKELARSLQVVVVSAHQIDSEGMRKTIDEELELYNTAGCKRLSDPAQAVIGLIWDKKTNPNVMKMCVPKCTGGRIASTTLWCDLNVCKISDISSEPLLDDSTLSVPDEKELDEPSL